MNKNVLKSLFLATMLTMGTTAQAQTEDFAYQKYLIKNVATGKYWGAANDWGTRASLVEHPEYVWLDRQTDGTYKLESQVNNGGTSYYFNGDYMDNGSPVALTITEVQDGVYTIANGENYYGWDGTTTVLGKNLTAGGENALWTIQSLDAAKAALAGATAEQPLDATLLIEDHDFGRNNRYASSWSFEASNKNPSDGNNINNCAESYHSVFTLSQVLEGAPAGVYALSAQGFYRQDGSNNDNLPVFYANSETQTFPLKTGSENSMSDASVSFTSGLYTIEPIVFELNEGETLTIGAKLEGNTSLWCIWDNFVLTYYGKSSSIDEVKFGAMLKKLEDLRATATGLASEVYEAAAVKTNLETALSATESVAHEATALETAIAQLENAISAAEGSKTAKGILPKMEQLIGQTNVYTDEALEEYYGKWYQKYTNGTLTKEEALALQDPFVVTGWHAAVTCDNLLLSAWDTNPDFNNAPYYINTWSTEGVEGSSNYAGEEFGVPFFEYWTDDAGSLGEKTLTGTLNVEEGLYKVTALVRVRGKNGSNNPAGIGFQVNDGAEIDVTSGSKVGTSQFYQREFTALGEVGSDGVLNIKFNVAAENTISWLSFKNVKYAKTSWGEQLAEVIEAANEALNTHRMITGEERTALQEAIDNATGDEASVNDVVSAMNVFLASNDAYTELGVLQGGLFSFEELPYASKEKWNTLDKLIWKNAESAAECKTLINDIRTALRTYIESNSMAEGVKEAKDATSNIVNPDAEDGVNGWNTAFGVIGYNEESGEEVFSQGSIGIRSDEPFVDATGSSDWKYFDGGNWGAQAWDVSFSQDVALPAGKYLLTVAARASNELTSFNLFADDKKVEMDHIGAGDLTNGYFGRGWNDNSLEFTLDEEQTVNIGVQGVTQTQYNWMSFTRFRLIKLDGGELTTGISTTDNATKARPETIYNLSGQRVKAATKGLYIVNGKKVVVK